MSSEHSHLREWAELVGEDIADDARDEDRSRRSGPSGNQWLERSS